MCKHRGMRRYIPLALVVALVTVPVAGCGDDQKRPSSEDRVAMDRFADGARQWRNEGTEPWLKAFNVGSGRLAEVAPAAEAKMEAAIRTMSGGANGVAEPKIRRRLRAIVSTYRAKLAAVRSIDSAGYSMATINEGLAELKRQGIATEKAWNAYVAEAKRIWNSNPLAGLKVG